MADLVQPAFYAFETQNTTTLLPAGYTLHRTRRARALSLRVAPHTGVVVVAPLLAPAAMIGAFVRQHRPWVLRQLQRLAQTAAEIPRRWPYGPTLPYLGTEHVVQLEAGDSARVACAAPALLRVQLRRPTVQSARRLLKRWYLAEARRWCLAQAEGWQQHLGVTWTRLQVRDQRARWGSCSATGRLNFNYRLVMAPPAVLDYVVLHELLHRKEMNHSPRFWALVAQHCPGYREALAWLKRYGPYLGV